MKWIVNWQRQLANPTSLQIIARILKVYEELTGLKINRSIKKFLCHSGHPSKPISGGAGHFGLPGRETTDKVPGITIVNQKPIEGRLPADYTDDPAHYHCQSKNQSKVVFQPIIRTIQRRMECWKSNFLSYGGRLTLIKAVMSAIPIHFMQAMITVS